MFKFITFLMFAILFAAPAAIAKDIYYCPMHTFYTSDKPGNCPICGMSLVKKEEHARKAIEGTSGHAVVEISSQQMQLMGVKTAPVIKQNLVKMVRAAGQVSTNHELYQLQDEYIRSYVSYVTIYRNYRRFAGTSRNRDSHRALQLQLHDTKIKLLQLGLGEADIAKLEKVSWATPWKQPDFLFFSEGVEYWVIAQVFEQDLGYVEVGQNVDVEVPSYGDKIRGTIVSIAGIMDPQTRSANVIIKLVDYRGELKGNMFANVTIPVELNEYLMVPQSAVMDTGVKRIVYVQTKIGVFEPRAVEMGALGDNGWAVKSGLKEGELVAVEGNFLLDSESRVQAGIGGEKP